jgi:DNA-binding beta-propeller fold protein YncE
VYLPGGPYGIAFDRPRGRLWVTLPGRNELVGLPAHGRPHVVARHATVRQPDSVAVDAATGQVVVTGRTDGLLQLVTP